MADQSSTFPSDLIGIIKTPGNTLGGLMKEKKWITMFVLIMVLVAVIAYLVFPMKMAEMAKTPQYAEMFPEGQDQYFSDGSSFPRFAGSFIAMFFVFVSLSLGAFFLYLFYGIAGVDALYVNYFSLTINASLIDVGFSTILSAIALISGVNLAFLQTPLLALASPEPGSITQFLLSNLNVLTIWYTVIIAAGISVYSKMNFKKSLTIAFSYFLFKALISIGFAYIAAKIVGAGTAAMATG